jgi:capsule polysaccharide export protein KpsE/RkpR
MRAAIFQSAQAVAFFTERRRETLDRLAEAEATLIASRRLEAAQAAGDETLVGVAPAGNRLQQAIQTVLATLGARSAGSQTTLNPQDPAVRRQRAEIAALSRQLADQIRATHAQRIRQLEPRERQREALARDLATLQAELPRWWELRREVDSSRRADEFNEAR